MLATPHNIFTNMHTCTRRKQESAHKGQPKPTEDLSSVLEFIQGLRLLNFTFQKISNCITFQTR